MFKNIICVSVIFSSFSSEKRDATNWSITDDDFEEVIRTVNGPVGAIIELYEKKNLNVAKNIFLYFKHYENKYVYSDPYESISVETQMNFQLKHNELYRKYDEDVKKYLVLT